MAEDAPKFTLRFHSQRTHDLLGVVAGQLGVSKNKLAEDMLERELETAALLVSRDLDETLRKLRAYPREERLASDIRAIAEAEAYADDPLKAQMVKPTTASDPYGVLAAFGA